MPLERRQLILFGALFAAVVAVLSLGYFLFLRPDFGTLYADLREADAATIIAELEAEGIDYRVAGNGHTVLVPSEDIDRARVLVAGAGIAMGGVVGFELFNDSDMGLTEFAQKVNYQRALQGELARTIAMMDGIEFARVHLSIPERSLFRADAEEPKAAVTVERTRGSRLGEDRVIGIQRLVASAVTGLEARDVAVLNEAGQLLSNTAGKRANAMLDERSALEQYFRARAETAASAILPKIPFEINVNAITLSTDSMLDRTDSATADMGNDREEPARSRPRDFRLRILLRTEDPLETGDEDMLRSAIEQAVQLDAQAGDVLAFQVGPLGLSDNGSFRSTTPTQQPSSAGNQVAPAARLPVSLNAFWIALIGALAIAAAVFIANRRNRLSPAERKSFAELLEARVSADEELADA